MATGYDLIGAGVLVIFLGFLLLFVGFLVEFLRASRDARGEGSSRREGGGVIFIGPIPIVFGSNRKISKVMLAIALIITVVWVTLFLIGSGII